MTDSQVYGLNFVEVINLKCMFHVPYDHSLSFYQTKLQFSKEILQGLLIPRDQPHISNLNYRLGLIEIANAKIWK